MKQIFKDPSVFNEDDMLPCRCDCGNWFDLHDGHRSIDPYKRNTLVCEECHEFEKYEENMREAGAELNEIDDYEEEWDEEGLTEFDYEGDWYDENDYRDTDEEVD
jgi:hypothetical protein